MRTRQFVACLCGSILLLLSLVAAALAESQTGVVAWCFDGDTFKLRDRRIVRLAGIDAPETAHKDKPAQYYSRQSRQLLESLARGKTVTLVFPGVSQKDRYGRLIADVLLPDGQSLNDLMIKSGAAFFYPHRDLGPDFQERLRNLQAEAINARAGMWEHLLSLPLSRQSYTGNRESLRFWPDWCPVARRLKPANQEHFGNLMDAFLAGYAPARNCIFWPEADR